MIILRLYGEWGISLRLCKLEAVTDIISRNEVNNGKAFD